MPVPTLVAAVIGALLLGGCGRPIPSVRATAQPEGEFLRVKSVQQAQAEDAHAQNLRREHTVALESALPPATVNAPAATQPATRPDETPPTAVPVREASPERPENP
ncbi:MAG: hypothetical protein NTV86_17005 [Planctomycetota bacterium]|nr:hypothetical protein [Planctomycetota bacterium]